MNSYDLITKFFRYLKNFKKQKVSCCILKSNLFTYLRRNFVKQLLEAEDFDL